MLSKNIHIVDDLTLAGISLIEHFFYKMNELMNDIFYLFSFPKHFFSKYDKLIKPADSKETGITAKKNFFWVVQKVLGTIL